MEKWKERHKIAHQGWMYAIQRIDLLIIAISGAGIYLALEVLKFIVTFNKVFSNTIYIKSGGVFFVLAIVINFISQYTGMLSNKHDMLWCEMKTDTGDSPNDEQLAAMTISDYKAEKYDCITTKLNITSMLVMFLGIASITYFFLSSF
jgi:hypothetical protein